MTYLGYVFLLDFIIFTTTDDEKEEKVNSSSISILQEGFYLKLRRKIWKFKNGFDSQ